MQRELTVIQQALERLKLGNWPPLASHLVCLILGTAGAHVVTQLPAGISYIPGTLTLTVEAPHDVNGDSPLTLVLLRRSSGPCTPLRKKPEFIRTGHLLTARFPTRDLHALAQVTRDGSIAIHAGEAPPCSPRVIFPKSGA
jgi:hypothetical protein